MRIVALMTVLVVARTAAAEDAAALSAAGEELARTGRYTEAIEAFKAADRLEHHTSHACLIGLAYTRRELWPQAEIYMDLCHRRATAADPLPDWVATADAQIADRLAVANVAAIEIHTLPTEEGVALSVSDFAPDETFSPRTIHLAPGHHVLTATSSRFETKRIAVEITDRLPRSVTIDLRRKPPITVHPGRTVPWLLIGGGSAVTAGAIALHVFWYKPARDELARAYDGIEAAKVDGTFTTRRTITIATYGVGLVTLVTGIALRATRYRDRLEFVGSSESGGAVLGIEWRQ